MSTRRRNPPQVSALSHVGSAAGSVDPSQLMRSNPCVLGSGEDLEGKHDPSKTLPPIVPVLFLLGDGAFLVDKFLRSRFARGHGRSQRPAGRRLQCSAVLPGEYPAGTQIDGSVGIIEMLVTHERHVLDRAAEGVHDGLQRIVRRRALDERAGRASGRYLRGTEPHARLAFVRSPRENISDLVTNSHVTR